MRTTVRILAAVLLGSAVYWLMELALTGAGVGPLGMLGVFISPMTIFGTLAIGLLCVLTYVVLGLRFRRR